MKVENPALQDINELRQKGFRPEVVGCVINQDKRLLLLFKREHKLWQLPQGGIGRQETVKQALLREMEEELGEEFVKRCVISEKPVIYFDQVEFPLRTKGSRKLVTDEGEEVFMEGKAYFFCLVYFQNGELDLRKTEFDEFAWVTLKNVQFLAEKLQQKGKRRITLGVLKVLKEGDLIE